MRFLAIKLLLGAALLAAVPMVASADSSFYQGPIFGIDTANGTLVVADSAQGIVNGDDGALIAALPGISDVTPRSGGGYWAVGATEEATLLYKVVNGQATTFADLSAYEAKRNPHPAFVDSNPFDVQDLGRGEAVVADAAGNDVLKINKHGKVKLVAVLPDELVSTENAKSLFGCPEGPPDICDLPPMIPAEPVATSVAIGPDGAYYVGELKGFPGPVGESRVWRIDPNAQNARCGQSNKCAVAFDGFTSIIDMRFGPDGRLYVAQLEDSSFLGLELAEGPEDILGGSVHACDLDTGECEEVASGIPILTSIAFRGAEMWGAILSLLPGEADVVPLSP
jgi:hypothetical protein